MQSLRAGPMAEGGGTLAQGLHRANDHHQWKFFQKQNFPPGIQEGDNLLSILRSRPRSQKNVPGSSMGTELNKGKLLKIISYGKLNCCNQ